MAFKSRLEFWKIADPSAGPRISVLDRPLAAAVEVSADMESPAALPIPATHENYALSVTAISGTFTIEVASTPEEDSDYGRLLLEGSQHWFIARPGDKYMIVEYL